MIITRGQQGYTFIELIVVSAIVMLLASAVMPLARVTARRQREAELRRALREIRVAIDKYKDACDYNQLGSPKLDSDCYPENIESLVEGVKASGAVDKKVKWLTT